MELQRLLSILIIAAAATKFVSSERQTLASFYGELLETFEWVQDEDPFIAILRRVDRNCVREKMRLEQNGEKNLEIRDDLMVFWMSHEICLADKKQAWDLVMDHLLAQTSGYYDYASDDGTAADPPRQLSDDEIYCIKENLHDRQPNAAILDGFETKVGANCEKDVKIFVFYLQLFVQRGSPVYDFKEFPKKEIEALQLKLQLLKFMKDEEKKKDEIAKLKVELQETVLKAHEKTMMRIDGL
jgi:hypothetical protein